MASVQLYPLISWLSTVSTQTLDIADEDTYLSEQEAVRYVLGEHESGHEMMHGPRLTTMRPQHERGEAALPVKTKTTQ